MWGWGKEDELPKEEKEMRGTIDDRESQEEGRKTGEMKEEGEKAERQVV